MGDTEQTCGDEWSDGALGLVWRCVRPPHPANPGQHHYQRVA